MKLSGSSNDTSASANASPVVNKHEHPPTPTIEEQLDSLVQQHAHFGHGGIGLSRCTSFDAQELEEFLKGLALLITKAEEQALLNYATRLRQEFIKRDLSSDVMPKGARKLTNEELIIHTLAPTQPSYSPAPGTDGEA